MIITSRFRLLILLAVLACAATKFLPRQIASAISPQTTETTISTIAGGGFGSDVPARQAPMVLPTAVALDPRGRGFFVVDEVDGTSLLRFASTSSVPVTLAGVTIQPGNINLIAGGGVQSDDGISPLDTDLAQVTGVAVDPSGDAVYLTIPSFLAIRVINVGAQNLTVLGKTIVPGTISTVASPDQATFRAVAIHPTTREIHFIAGRLVLKLNSSGGQVVVAGGGNPQTGNGDGGPATSARLTTPTGLVFESNNSLLIADGGDARTIQGSVRRVNITGTISTVASGLEYPTGITVSPTGDIYVALGNAQQIMRINSVGVKTIVAGNPNMQLCDVNNSPTCGDGASALQAYLNIPDSTANTTLGIAVDGRGLYLPDFRYKRIRFVTLTGGTQTILGTTIPLNVINTIVGSGQPSPYDNTQATYAELFAPTGVAADSQGNLFIADSGNNRLRFVNRTNAPVTLFVTTPYATTVQPGQIITLNREAGEFQVDDRITTALFLTPQGLYPAANGLFITDSQAGALIKVPPTSVTGRRSGIIRFLNTSNADVTFFPGSGDAKVVVPPGQIKDIAGVRPPNNPQSLGDGMPANRVAFFPTDVAVDRAGNVFIADQGNNRIRKVDAQSGTVSTVFGDGTQQTLFGPTGIAFDGAGRLHIADTRNNRILRQDTPTATTFSVIADGSRNIRRPRDLTVDVSGKIFITNAVSQQILDLQAPNNSLGTTSVVAGTGSPGFSGDGGDGPLARLNLPNPGTATNDIQVTCSIATLANGDLIFTDTVNNRVRMLKRKAGTPPVTSVSAASFSGIELAPESIVAAFGDKLATQISSSNTIPLPTTLGGTTVTIRDSNGIERMAPLFFVAPTQINYLVPSGTAPGLATIIVASGDGTLSTGTLNVASVAPGFFSTNANGQGLASAVALRLKSDGQLIYESISRFDTTTGHYVPVPIDLGPATDQVFLVAYGTGWRFRSSLAGVNAMVGGLNSEVLFAGAADGYVGLDQCNIRLPRALIGRGEVNVVLNVDNKTANTVTIQIK
ncbi:MAG: hypothetical protein JST85_20255 [Acidobacteria bacterium]|nr:hypothetical protein [Acidobacteriota bacterium]